MHKCVHFPQYDNFGLGAVHLLPNIVVNKPNQVIEIRKKSNNELIRIFRMKGNSIQFGLYHPGTFSIKVGEGDNVKALKGLKAVKGNIEIVNVEL